MSGAVTIQVQDLGGWTLDELKKNIEEYVSSIIKAKPYAEKKDFGRKFGIAKTENYWIAPDFNATPDCFSEYM